MNETVQRQIHALNLESMNAERLANLEVLFRQVGKAAAISSATARNSREKAVLVTLRRFPSWNLLSKQHQKRLER